MPRRRASAAAALGLQRPDLLVLEHLVDHPVEVLSMSDPRCSGLAHDHAGTAIATIVPTRRRTVDACRNNAPTKPPMAMKRCGTRPAHGRIVLAGADRISDGEPGIHDPRTAPRDRRRRASARTTGKTTEGEEDDPDRDRETHDRTTRAGDSGTASPAVAIEHDATTPTPK